jgi:hypothetical protein
MDLEEWEFLPDDGFLDFHEGGEKKNFLGKRNSDPKTVFNMNYFICPSPNNPKKIIEPSSPPGNSRLPSQLVTVPIHLEPPSGKTHHHDDELVVNEIITKVPIEINVLSPASPPNTADQDTVSKVFFKMKENEFVDMKMDSPKSGSRGFMPQIDTFQFEDKGETLESKSMSSPRMKVEKDLVLSKKNSMDCDANNIEEINWEETNGKLNIWKWSLTGIGAICSFGVAAATICVLFFGSQQRNNHLQHNHKLRFQIYTDDKVSNFPIAMLFNHRRSNTNFYMFEPYWINNICAYSFYDHTKYSKVNIVIILGFRNKRQVNLHMTIQQEHISY